MSQKTWGGRFDGDTDQRVEAFTESIHVDHRLFRHDIRASIAHATMLGEVGLMTPDEAGTIVGHLREIEVEIAEGRIAFSISLEDIHTHIERALIERAGDLGRKLHTARSRNDQVATDTKLLLRDAIDRVDELLRDVQRGYLTCARRELGVIVPGYTHLQRAQPVLATHYFLAYVEKFARDRDRLSDCRKRLNRLPLGTAALAGTSLAIDRHRVAELLGFDGLVENSLDASSDRDYLVEFVFCLSLVAVHLSGWAEEWVIWSSTEFDFLKLPDAFCTGSSIMPHKKNPDVLELTRGKTGRVVGALQTLLVLLKGLPLAYNRDLQEDKPPLFDALDTVVGCLSVVAPLIAETTLNRETIAARLDRGFLDATTLMEALIQQGVPMRSAHEVVGKLVREAEAGTGRLADLPVSAFEAVAPGRGAEVHARLGVRNAVEAFQSVGSTAPDEVSRQLELWESRLK